jgi:drug/metabolite transporter (DMT)-like permease
VLPTSPPRNGVCFRGGPNDRPRAEGLQSHPGEYVRTSFQVFQYPRGIVSTLNARSVLAMRRLRSAISAAVTAVMGWLTASTEWQTHGVMIGVVLVTSVSVVITKVGLNYVRPVPFTSARFGIAALVLFAIASGRGHRFWTPPRLAVLVPAGLLGVVANSLFFAFGLRLSTAVDVSLIVGLSPIVTALIVVGTVRRVPPIQQIIALPLGFLGVVAVVGPHITGGSNGIGDLIALGIPLSWSLFLVLVTAEAGQYPATVFAPWTMLIGLLILVPLGLAQTVDGQDRWGPALVPLLISAIFGTATSFTAFLWCLPRMGTTGTAIYGYLQPPIGAAAAAALLHESFGALQIAGGLAILVAALLANWKKIAVNVPSSPS